MPCLFSYCVFIHGFGLSVCAKATCLDTLFLLIELMSLTSNLQYESTGEIKCVACSLFLVSCTFFFTLMIFGSAELIKVASSFQYVV